MKPEDKQTESLATLEDPGSLVVAAEPGASSASQPSPNQPASTPDPVLPKKRRFRSIVRRFTARSNVYLIGLVITVALVVGAIYMGIRLNRQSGTLADLPGQSLSAEELSKLQGSDANVGDPKQILTIESNTVINGRVLLRDDLDVAGTIKVGGSVTLPGITVAGTSNFDQVQASRLTISGDTNVQGQLGVQRNLTVSGNATIGGTLSAVQLAIQTLSLSGDLQLNRHIDGGGGTPGKTDGGSLGGGGTTSISGTDTAGTATINTGSGPSAGCYITVSFAQKFNSTPHVVITPVSSAAGSLAYYINRTSTGFSICSTTAPAASTTFSFDYIAID